jgi:4-hydroxybutyryl-CoA dehydratase/vinylacetyl-CoA-Delta-isomerase
LPTYEDCESPKLKKYIEKYLKGGAEAAEPRIKMFRLIQDLTGDSPYAARNLFLSTHGGGSPEAMRILLARSYDLEERKKLAKRLAGITE